MSRHKVPALALALLLAGALAPRPAHGGLHDEPTAAAAASGHEAPAVVPAAPDDAPAPAASAPPAPPAQDAPKPRGNAFVRALTAPFRALAKLFGGGRKSSDGAAQKREEKSLEAQRSNGGAQNPVGRETAEESPATAASEPPRPAAPATPAAAPGGVNIVRPDEQARSAPKAAVWTPVIEGIAKDPLTQGRALLQHGYLNEAIAELTVAAAAGDNLVEANNLLGLAYDRLGWHREAVEAYERARTVAPQDPVLLANLGYSLYLSNDFPGALKRLRQAARLAPHLNVVHNNLGIVHARLGRYDDAFKSFARASNEYDAHLKLASILEFEKRDKQAIRHYEAALRLQPGTSAVLERLVALYERTGDRTKADTARRALGQPRNDQRTTTGGG